MLVEIFGFTPVIPPSSIALKLCQMQGITNIRYYECTRGLITPESCELEERLGRTPSPYELPLSFIDGRYVGGVNALRDAIMK
ncbi:MAG: hypothetical protein ACRC3J_01905 [Culicoidibacterales bacterium]